MRTIPFAAPLIAAAALFAAACASPVQGGHKAGNLVLAVEIPAAATPTLSAGAAAALKSRLGPARYLHPDTKTIVARVSGAGFADIESRVDAASGSVTTLTVEAIPVGNGRVVAVTLLDGSGTVLCSGSATLDIQAGANNATIPVAPIAEASFVPGPYDGATRGVQISNASGALRIYSVALPKTGAYRAAVDDGGTLLGSFDAYDPDGAPITGIEKDGSADSYGCFTAARTGTYFLVVQPATNNSLNIEVDADTRASYEGPSLYVSDSLTVMDKDCAYRIVSNCGFQSVDASQVYEGETHLTMLLDGISADKRTVGFSGSLAVSASGTSLGFPGVDNLLGIARSFSASIPAPRRVYYSDPAQDGSGDGLWGGTPWNSLRSPAAAVAADSAPMVIALFAGNLPAENAQVLLSYPALVLGGCDAATWGRSAVHGRTTVNLDATQTNPFLLAGSAAGSSIRDVDILASAENLAGNLNVLNVAGPALFYETTVRTAINNTSSGASHTIQLASLSLPSGYCVFDRCSLIGGRSKADGPTDAYGVVGESGCAGGIALVDSVVHPGTLEDTNGNAQSGRGLLAWNAAAQVVAVGSTISGGLISTSVSFYRSIALDIAGLDNLRMFNSLVIWGTRDAGDNSNALGYTGNANSRLAYNLFCPYGYSGVPTNMAFYDGSPLAWGDIVPSLYPATNGYADFSALGISGFGYGDPIPNLKSGASAGSAVKSGGVDATGYTFWYNEGLDSFLSYLQNLGIAADMGVDRDGKARTAPYARGAYELD